MEHAEFLDPDGISLMLQVEGVDFVARMRNLLRGAKRFGLRQTKRFLMLAELVFNCVQRVLLLAERLSMDFEIGQRGRESFG